MKKKRKILVVSSVTPGVLKIARGLGVSLIAHEKDIDSPVKVNFPLQQVCLSMNDRLVYRWLKESIDKAKEYYLANRESLLYLTTRMKLTEKVIERFFSAYFSNMLADDYRLIILAETFFSEDEKIYIFKQPEISSHFIKDGKILRLDKTYKWYGMKKVFALPLCLVLWLPWKPRRRTQAMLVVEPYHNHYLMNDEFHQIIHILESQAYNIAYFMKSSSNELGRELLKRGKRVIAWKDLRLDVSTFLQGLKDYLVGIAWSCNKRVPRLLKIGCFGLLFERYKYKALVQTCDFRYLLKIRGDLCLCSTLIKQTIKSKGAKSIGYSHATHYHPDYYVANIDFDYYGYSGPAELETFREYWPDKEVNYIRAGQMSAEASRRIKSWQELGRQRREKELAVGIFPTSTEKYTIPNTQETYDDFIRIAFRCTAKYTKEQIILKDKLNLRLTRGDKVNNGEIILAKKVVEENINRYALSPITTWYDSPNENWRRLSAVDAFHLIDIGLVLWESTCAFELLALQKKVLVYWPFQAVKHLFAKYTPWLVASDMDTFERHFDILVNMAEDEYKTYIAPTIDYCGKKSNGCMVADFFRQIDEGLIRKGKI